MADDIKPKWFSVIRRLQSVSKSNGAAIITIKILVDQNGDPVLWTEPEKLLIEPSSKASSIINFLLGENSDTM